MFYFFQGRFTFFLLLIPPYNHCNYTVFHLLSQVTERHETVMAQLMSGDPKNQNIPGLDAILRGEVLRKDALIAQLMNQGNNQSGFLDTL